MSGDRPVHSPLGASGAERWMNCAGSVALLKHMDLPQSDDPDYRKNGSAAHEVAKVCLEEGGDAWEAIGTTYAGVVIDAEIANAVQVYVDECRSLMVDGANVHIEFGIDAPDFHDKFYGTLDFGVVQGNTLRIRDYKHGEGVVVEAENNPQILYYAYGLLRHYPDVVNVEVGIVQPRAFHPDGPIRTWECSADYVREWASQTLLPAMLRTEFDTDLDAGKWCRFCPAKLVCPLQTSLFGAAMTADYKIIPNLNDQSLGRSYQYISAVKSYIKALEEETMRRAMDGRVIPGVKLVLQKANRVFKPEAENIFKRLLGEAAYSKPALLSPAQMEKAGPEAKELVREYAYTPNNGYTIAPDTDKRVAVKVEKASEAFAATVKNLEG